MSDLRVALRFQAHAGNSRREIEQINRDLRKAGKEGAKSLADESWKASSAISKVGQVGANSYKVIRAAMRETATAGSGTRIEVSKTTAELKDMANAARKAARDAKTELQSTDRQGVQPLRQSVDKTEASFRRMAQNSGRSLRTLKTIAMGVRQEFDRIKGLGGSMQGKLAGLGVGVGVVAGLKANSDLERVLIRTKQTAGMTNEEKDEWHKEGWRIAKTYGASRSDVDTGFNTLIASGVNYDAAKITGDAIGQANAITGANPAILGKAVVAASGAFNINLNKDGAALDLLQKMTVAGRLGNAELENLSDLFPKIGGAAAAAGMSIEQALAFTESLSKVELQPDRLGTLAESTLRVFSNKQYRDQVAKVTGVNFYNKDKSSRNPEEVFGEIKRKYEAMKNDEQRAKFMGVVFKGMDQDTVRGWRSMLTGDRLDDLKSGAKTLGNAEPIYSKDLKENTESSSGAAARMKATLAEAMDRMATPLNKGLADMGSYLLDDLNLSGAQMLAGGAALGVGGYYAARGAKSGAGALLNKFMGGPETLKNIAVGKVLEEATGVTSVFVTNWPGGVPLGGGLPDLPNSTTAGKGKTGGFIAPWLGPIAVGATATQIAGASTTGTDEGRLDAAMRSKLLNDGERTYQTAFYQNRMDLAGQNPNQTSDWLSSQAQRLAHQQTGMTAAGLPIDGANQWASGIANRAINAGAETPAAAARLQRLLDQPLVIELRMDSNMIQAEVERRTDIQMRRGR
ncbi:phage tail tape measure protein [Pseudomonas extremaustralis]|uniref:Phage tail tape measure protein n=1 Tax=Pseudomonas extremaustralis TaxID=359110 RepID=A0A5C5QCU7_9PSED|nr:phage tail tape measure protein [Pseudomonas extremaustralis]EZI28387.1 phage tail protein [Pseudomonas extremaustralis 14-3 substr. 14-3b]TWS03140.1 phage tail tape measure protein [Pseudomonas extremaustralis]SDE86774.1 Phage-related minor tail protein [Pseudomonas extremaustralis]